MATKLRLLENGASANTMGIANGRTNIIGALLASCLLTATLFTGSVNADVFFAWLSQDLLAKLPTNSVIVMDNATFHKRDDARLLIEQARQCWNSYRLIHLTEHKWAQAKALRRKKNCSTHALFTQLF